MYGGRADRTAERPGDGESVLRNAAARYGFLHCRKRFQFRAGCRGRYLPDLRRVKRHPLPDYGGRSCGSSIGNLGETHLWIIKNGDFPLAGRYLMIDEISDDPEYYYIYQYVYEEELNTWGGLPLGEYLPEEW